MARKENVEKNMEFLIKELQKEWDVSKQDKHTVNVTLAESKQLRNRIQKKIAEVGEILAENEALSFKESMVICKENYVTLRVARKITEAERETETLDHAEFHIAFDKEEYSCFRGLFKE